MNTIIHPLRTASTRSRRSDVSSNEENFRKPHYVCAMEDTHLALTVYTPGVDAAGVEIAARGPDLIITARKARFVRTNWQTLHLERVQKDYRLILRLGNALDFGHLDAELVEGVLTLRIPNKGSCRRVATEPLARVA